MNYTIINFSTATGTMTVAFEDYLSSPQPITVNSEGLTTATLTTTVLNYNAPRKNGVYLEGNEFEDYICMLAGEPLTGALTQEELDQMVEEMAQDDPGTVVGSEYILSKYRAYLTAQGTPEEVIEILVNM